MSVAAVVLASGCATSNITRQDPLVKGVLPKPSQILVMDFVSSARDIPADSAIRQEFSIDDTPQTKEEIAEGRQLGAEMAEQLAVHIREMGLPALRVTGASKPRINDILLRGFLVSIDEGSTAKRVGIGFGAGASELHTVLEGFQVTPKGLRKLGSGKLEAGGAKTPGAAMGAAALIATANPVGLIVSTGMKVHGEKSGSSKLEGRAKETTQEIAEALRIRFQEAGWIQ